MKVILTDSLRGESLSGHFMEQEVSYQINRFKKGDNVIEYVMLPGNGETTTVYSEDGEEHEYVTQWSIVDPSTEDPVKELFTATLQYMKLVCVSEEEGEEPYTPTDGDYVEIPIIGFQDAWVPAVIQSNTPEPTPPTPTVNYVIVSATRNYEPEFFDYEPDPELYPEDMVLYPLGQYASEDEEEFSGVWVFWDDDGWTPDYKLDTIYDAQTVSNIQADMQYGDGETVYRLAWVAIDPPADSGNSGSDDEDEEGDEE